ncbi:unnamed protein product [Closterium sp. NIES-53]
MVLWELTLATAYFLGLKRTYRLALKIQKRVLLARPGIRDFAKRRTRAVFRVALTAVETIQHRDIEIGRSVGNFLLRFLDRMKPSAHIRGDGPHMPGGAGGGGVHSSHAPPTPGGAAGGAPSNHAPITGGTAGGSGAVSRHGVGGSHAGEAAAGQHTIGSNGSSGSSSSRSFSTVIGQGGSSSRSSSSSPVSRCVGSQGHLRTHAFTFNSNRKPPFFSQNLPFLAHLQALTTIPGHTLQSRALQIHGAPSLVLPAALQARDSLPAMPHYLQSPVFQKALFPSQLIPAPSTLITGGMSADVTSMIEAAAQQLKCRQSSGDRLVELGLPGIG